MISSMLPAKQISWKWKFAQKVGTLEIPPSAKVTMRLEHWPVQSIRRIRLFHGIKLGQGIKDEEVEKDVLPALR